MNGARPFRAILAAVVAVGLAASGAALASGTGPPSSAKLQPRITASGVGPVKLGRSYTTLRRRHAIGRIRHGCELGGPGTRAARLRGPLRGSVDFTLKSPRRVNDILVTGGATARGVGIGATYADIKAAFPVVKVEHATEEVFGLTLVKVPKGHGGRLEFAISTETGRIETIGIPFLGFCE